VQLYLLPTSNNHIPNELGLASFYVGFFLHLFRLFRLDDLLPSVLWCCWFGGRQGIWPVKNLEVGSWCGHLSGVRCRFAYGPADATATHCLLLQ